MNYARLDPGLIVVLDDLRREGRTGLRRHTPFLGLLSVEALRRPARAVVFIDVDVDVDVDDGAGLSSIPDGVEVNAARGRVRTAVAALESIEALARVDGVRRVVAARRLRPHTGAAGPAARTSFRNSTGLSGKGVVVGVIDTGIETSHPAFAGRILRLWDQTLAGAGVVEAGYGTELTGEMLQLSRDTEGHGTHVAGIAAGEDSTYPGVAPGAELVVVKSDLIDAHVADGLRYVFRVATELSRPAVVVLPAGGAADAHDGTDPLSLVIDAESGRGRVICCSAGNEGNASVHAQLELRPGGSAIVSCAVRSPSIGEAAVTAHFSGWYAGADELAVAVVSPSGAQTPFQPVIVDGPPARLYQLPGGDVRVVTPGPDPGNSDHTFLVGVTPSAPSAVPPSPTGWALRLRGDRVTAGRVDVWSLDGSLGQLAGNHVRDSMMIGAPAAASQALTVGSYTTTVQWVNVMGHPHEAGFILDDVSDFSSPGHPGATAPTSPTWWRREP